MNTEPTYRIAQVLGASGETGELPLRNAAPGSSGGGSLSNKQIDAAVKAWFAIDEADHEPSFRERMRAAIAATPAPETASQGEKDHE